MTRSSKPRVTRPSATTVKVGAADEKPTVKNGGNRKLVSRNGHGTHAPGNILSK